MVAAHFELPSSFQTPLRFAPRHDPDGVRDFWRHVVSHPAHAIVARGGAGGRLLIVSGWACEVAEHTPDAPVICSLLLPGDVVETAALGEERKISALTVVETVDCSIFAGREDVEAVRLAVEASVERGEERVFSQMLRVGRLSARERLASLLIELHDRLEAAGRARAGRFRIPLTQELIAGFLGLSRAHLKRTLQELRDDGLISFSRGWVSVVEREALAELAWCSPPRLDGAAARRGSRHPADRGALRCPAG